MGFVFRLYFLNRPPKLDDLKIADWKKYIKKYTKYKKAKGGWGGGDGERERGCMQQEWTTQTSHLITSKCSQFLLKRAQFSYDLNLLPKTSLKFVYSSTSTRFQRLSLKIRPLCIIYLSISISIYIYIDTHTPIYPSVYMLACQVVVTADD